MVLRRHLWLASLLALVGAILAVFVVYTLVAVAQQDQERITLGVSPQLLDLTANPGELQTTTFRVTNASEKGVVVKAIPKNFTPRGEEGAVDITEDETSFSLADWVTVEPSSATIGSNKTQDFKVTFDVPPNVEPGSHFGSVVFATIPPENENADALVSQEIAPVILIKVAGDIVETLEIEEFKTADSFYSNQPTIQLISRLKNTGTAHFKPKGQIVIKNIFGGEVAKLDIDERNVLPDSIRQITTDWNKQGFKLGKYTAELTVVYGQNNEIATAKTSFIIFPYQIVLPIVAVLAILGWVTYKGRHRISLAYKALSGKDQNRKD